MTLSTHVLDVVRGLPASDLAVRLDRRNEDGEWRPAARARTDADGRVSTWAATPTGAEYVPDAGVHRLVFDTAALSDFFPEVTVIFRIRDRERHHHVPLLVSAYSYSTYRGS